MSELRYGWNFSLSVQLDISLICCTHLRDIKLNTQVEIPYLYKQTDNLFSQFSEDF